eukprot:11206644-Lingulodinium_polyedra.AAC.1
MSTCDSELVASVPPWRKKFPQREAHAPDGHLSDVQESSAHAACEPTLDPAGSSAQPHPRRRRQCRR